MSDDINVLHGKNEITFELFCNNARYKKRNQKLSGCVARDSLAKIAVDSFVVR